MSSNGGLLSAMKAPDKRLSIMVLPAVLVMLVSPFVSPSIGLLMGLVPSIAYIHCAVNVRHLMPRNNPLIGPDPCSALTRFKALNAMCLIMSALGVLMYIGTWALEMSDVAYPDLGPASMVSFGLISVLPLFIIELLFYYGTYKVEGQLMTLATFASIFAMMLPCAIMYEYALNDFNSLNIALNVQDGTLIVAATVLLVVTVMLEMFVKKNVADKDGIGTDGE